WTSSPFLKRAILGEEGGKGTIRSLAAFTASVSTPAKTVTRWAGFFVFLKLILAAGLAFAAAHPQTEFTTTKVVPSWLMALSTASAVYNSSNPADAKSCLIGFTSSAGYIYFVFAQLLISFQR